MDEKTLPKLLVSMEVAKRKIQERINKGQTFLNRQIDSEDELEISGKEANNWSRYNSDLLTTLFANFSVEKQYQDFFYPRLSDRDRWEHADGLGEYHILKLDWKVGEYREDMTDSIKSLEGIRDRLELFDEPDSSTRTFGDKIFIIHGRDDSAKDAVTVFIRDLGFKEIILERQPNSGLTIVEKFERHAGEVDFAIALLTPDDVGALREEADDQLKLRARQNVIFELGYFMGKLGREKVCLLIKGELENPSDLNGILYVPMDELQAWRDKLAKEMQSAELPVDRNKL